MLLHTPHIADFSLVEFGRLPLLLLSYLYVVLVLVAHCVVRCSCFRPILRFVSVLPSNCLHFLTQGASRMIRSTKYLRVTDLPITCLLASYTGRAPVSEKKRPGSLPLAVA
uniref:Uncharacterized protein n=1 Tax=Candidatus Kentrum sp. TC TaxID=2126339 RepID=A0A450Z4Q8_9GAMM|nr:MAG: hypothetical protein BECKTC1821E_GA0114239_11304 [Candidatus Kentron sp. TC]